MWWQNLKLATQDVLAASGVETADIKAIGISFYPFKKIKHALTLCNLTFQYNGVKRPVV